MIKALIFDCFGVLYPQATGNFYQRNRGLFKDSGALDELNAQIDSGRITRQQFFEGLSEITGRPAADIHKEIDNELQYDRALVELIRSLKNSYKIGLLSNAGEEEIAILYQDALDNLFDVITVSYAAQMVKPQPEIYEECLRRLGVNPYEAVFIDDSQANLLTAKKLGMQVIAYPDFGVIPDALIKLQGKEKAEL